MTDRKESWHLSKSVPVALILAIAVQVGLTIRWGSKIEAAVETHEDRLDRHDAIIEAMRSTANSQAVTLGRIEETSQSTLRMVERLISKLENPPGDRPR